MEESITVEQIKKTYNSISGKIKTLKQKKYKALQDYFEKTEDIYLNTEEKNINEELKKQEEDLEKKLYEINVLKNEQNNILERLSKYCEKQIEKYYEELNIYADINYYFQKLYNCEDEINELNKIIDNSDFPFFMKEDKQELAELSKEKEKIINTIAQIIPSYTGLNIKQQQKYNNDSKDNLEKQKREVKEYSNLYIKVENIINEKTYDELIVLDTLKLSRRKRIVQEIKNNLKENNLETNTEEKKENEYLDLNDFIKPEEAKDEPSKLTPERKKEMQEVLDKYEEEKKEDDYLEAIDFSLNEETKEESSKLTPERMKKMQEVLDKYEDETKEDNLEAIDFSLNGEVKKETTDKKNIETIANVTFETREPSSKLKKLKLVKEIAETMEQPQKEQVNQFFYGVNSSLNGQENNIETKQEEKKYSEGLSQFITQPIENKEETPQENKLTPAQQDMTYYRREIPIAAKIARAIEPEKKQNILKRATKNILEYFGIGLDKDQIIDEDEFIK